MKYALIVWSGLTLIVVGLLALSYVLYQLNGPVLPPEKLPF